jgi:3-phosphoshikimate 1-carboxyvinyltransferase
MPGSFFAGRAARGEVALPGGKSHAIRAALLAAQAKGESTILGAPAADDVERALGWIAAAGVRAAREGDSIRIVGIGGAPRFDATFDAGASAAVLRMGLFWLASGRGEARVVADSQLSGRPHGEGLRWLRSLGPRLDGDRLPLRMSASGLAGGRIEAPVGDTSQFISGCLLAAPSFAADLSLGLSGAIPSIDYLDATLAALGDFGVAAKWSDAQRGRLEIRTGAPRAASVRARPDASHTLLFACVPAILGGAVRLRGSAAPRERGLAALAAAGVAVRATDGGFEISGRPTAPIDLDAEADPDLVPPLAIAALFGAAPSRFRGVARLRLKESDRLAALVSAAAALGGRAEVRGVGAEGGTDLWVYPARELRGARLETRGDHRLAMSFGLAALAVEGVSLDDESCVSKSMPDYWERLRSAVG